MELSLLSRRAAAMAALLAALILVPLWGTPAESAFSADPEAEPAGERAGSTAAKRRGPAASSAPSAVGDTLPATPAAVDSLAQARELFSQRAFGPAEQLLQRILVRVEDRYGDRSPEAAEVLDLLVTCLWQVGKSQEEETQALAARAVELREELYGPEALETAMSLFNLGVIRAMLGDFAGADPLFQRVLDIRETHLPAGHGDIATAINALANIRFAREDFSGSLPLYRRALDMAEESGGPLSPPALSIRGNLANTLIQLGDHNEARAILEEQIALLESADLVTEDLAFACSLLGNVFFALGDHESVLPLRRRCLEVRQQVHPEIHPRMAQSYINLGNALWKLGRLEEGRREILRGRSIWEQIYGADHIYYSSFQEALGRIAFQQGDLAEARRLHESALEIREATTGKETPKVAEVLQSLARIAMREGRLADARRDLERAVAIVTDRIGPDFPLLASYRIDLAMVEYLDGALASAAEQALASESLSREHLRLTLRALPERQALTYARERTAGLDLILSLAGVLEEPDYRRRAWDALIRARALVLDEMAARQRRLSASQQPEAAQLLQAYQEAATRMANLYVRGPQDADPEMYRRRLEDARRELETADRALARRDAPYSLEQIESDIGWTHVQAALPEGTALVAYAKYRRFPIGSAADLEGTAAYCAFILSGDDEQPHFVSLGGAAGVEARIASWKQEAALGALRADRSGEAAQAAYVSAGSALRQAIWDPVEEYLGEAARVLVVPDGEIHLLNLATLPAGDERYLVETGPAFHYLSAEREVTSRRPGLPAGGALVLGAPDFDGPVAHAAGIAAGSEPALYRSQRPECGKLTAMQFRPLPGSLEEAHEIAGLARRRIRDGEAVRGGDPDVLLLTGAEATETALKRLAPGNRILHVATHGFFLSGECPSGVERTRGIGYLVPEGADTTREASGEAGRLRNPLLLSGLALAGANRRDEAAPGADDGILTAREIAALDLADVRWAVLSACETGTGEVLNGEGVLGLQRAFRIAGARTLITSLWAVSDEAARHWMRAFYRSGLDEERDAVDAVRDACLSVLDGRRSQGESTHPFYWGAFVASGDWR
ncbi:MAG: CHAT domain-containing protein [Candidatus Eisenbacteria bacterium]|nr:CHAT domain-containing protein [Candidatus Eisenbacteria bacterium]